MSSKLTTRYLSEQEYPGWNELVAGSAEGSIYNTPEYLDVLRSEIGATYKILVAERGGQMVGGIALVERSNRWGIYVSGRSLLYYNGFVLRAHPSKYPSECTAKRLETLSALEESITRSGYGRVQIKSRSSLQDVRIFVSRGWKANPSFTYTVQLEDLEKTWSRMEQNLRRLVNRCTQDGLQFAEDDDFDSFYRLHHQTHVRKGAAIYLTQEGFKRYFQRLRDQDLCRLFHARTIDGRVISTQLVLLGKHPVCHTVSAAADLEFLKTGATAFLRWKVFERLSKMGYKGNDLTDADLNPVTHFKSQLGGDLEMNFVLDQPDRGKFRIQNFVYRTGSLAKRGARTLVASLKDRGNTLKPATD